VRAALADVHACKAALAFSQQLPDIVTLHTHARVPTALLLLAEMVDLCAAAGWEPVITLSAQQSNGDYADLVEYCWGNSSTQWGAQRLADGHPQPYALRMVSVTASAPVIMPYLMGVSVRTVLCHGRLATRDRNSITEDSTVPQPLLASPLRSPRSTSLTAGGTGQ